MTADRTLELRRDELARRVDALPAEVDAWRERATNALDMQAHFSQLEAIKILIDELVKPQRTTLAQLNPADAGSFSDLSLNLVRQIIRSQRVWDFFRDKLELRFSPDFQEPLWVADAVAWDCYHTVMSNAEIEGIISSTHFREPPLTYLTADFSPATWVRGSRPNDGRNYALGEASSPVPVIELPWDHVENLWEVVSLHHEVGHDIEADLGLREALVASLKGRLAADGVAADRIDRWVAWEAELFADAVGMHLGGPGFLLGLMHLLILPTADVVTFNPDDPHPTHYPRILMDAAYLGSFTRPKPGQAGDPDLSGDADSIAAVWREIYGQRPEFDDYLAEAPAVFEAMMSTPLAPLNGKTVASLMPYTAVDHARVAEGAAYLGTNMNAPGPLTTAPRLCASAARIAAQDAEPHGTAPADEALRRTRLDEINQRLVTLVHDNVPPGVRASSDAASHRDFIASFADRIDVDEAS